MAIANYSENEAGSFVPEMNPGSRLKASKKERLLRFLRTRTCCSLSLAMAFLCAYMCYSIIAPFFGGEASKRDLHATQRAVVFTAYSLTAFISAPIVGYLVRKVSAKKLILFGCFLASLTCICFGFTYLIKEGEAFFWTTLSLRIAEGLGYGIFTTAGYTIIFNLFPDTFAKVIGLQETFAGIGLAAGPAIGGGLHELGGFVAPFLCVGTFFFVITCVLVYSIPSEREKSPVRENSEPENKIRVWDLFYDAQTCAAIMQVFSSSYAFAYVFPVLESHLTEQYALEEKYIALVFCALLAPYSVSTLLSGHIVNRKKQWLFHCIGGGWIALAGGYAIIGPTVFSDSIPNSLWTKVFALALIGLGLGFTIIPCFEALHRAATDAGFKDDIKTYGIISAAFNSTYALGEAVGPLVAGVTMDSGGFTYSMGIAMWLCVAMACLAFVSHHYGPIRDIMIDCRGKSKEKYEVDHGVVCEEDESGVKNGSASRSPNGETPAIWANDMQMLRAGTSFGFHPSNGIDGRVSPVA